MNSMKWFTHNIESYCTYSAYCIASSVSPSTVLYIALFIQCKLYYIIMYMKRSL